MPERMRWREIRITPLQIAHMLSLPSAVDTVDSFRDLVEARREADFRAVNRIRDVETARKTADINADQSYADIHRQWKNAVLFAGDTALVPLGMQLKPTVDQVEFRIVPLHSWSEAIETVFQWLPDDVMIGETSASFVDALGEIFDRHGVELLDQPPMERFEKFFAHMRDA